MVVKIVVLGKVQRGGGQPFDGGYFTRLANPDYYTAGGEPAGRWHGAGAVALGLTGIVESTAFANVLAGLRPDGTRLGEAKPSKCKRSKPKRVHPSKPKKPVIPGYDLCFSAPKSVSALWSVAAPAEIYSRLARFEYSTNPSRKRGPASPIRRTCDCSI
jgi:conjugative relaxase-like TrwC/TraI family protein